MIPIVMAEARATRTQTQDGGLLLPELVFVVVPLAAWLMFMSIFACRPLMPLWAPWALWLLDYGEPGSPGKGAPAKGRKAGG